MTTSQASPTLPQAFNTVRIPSQELASHPKLSVLTNLINTAFKVAAWDFPGLYDGETKRFEKSSDFLEELGPDGVTFVTFATEGDSSGDEPEIVATTSYKPFASLLRGSELREMLEVEMKAQHGAVENVDRTIKNDAVPGLDAKLERDLQLREQIQSSIPEEDDSAEDALKIAVTFVAVAPAWQKHGLASKLLAGIVEEINSQANAQGREDFTLVLNTMKEINGPYWTSKGFKTIEEERFPAGPFGSTTGFTISTMSRNHLVH